MTREMELERERDELRAKLAAAEVRAAELRRAAEHTQADHVIDRAFSAARAEERGAAAERAAALAYLRAHPSEQFGDARYWAHHWAGMLEDGAHLAHRAESPEDATRREIDEFNAARSHLDAIDDAAEAFAVGPHLAHRADGGE